MAMYAWSLIIETAGCSWGTHVRTNPVMWGSSTSHIPTITGNKGLSHHLPVKSTRSWENIHESVLLRCLLSFHYYNMDSVLWVTISSSIALTTKQVTGQLEHFSGWCLFPEAVCVCVCVVFRLILRHIVWYSQRCSTFYPPYSLVPQPTHCTEEAGEESQNVLQEVLRRTEASRCYYCSNSIIFLSNCN